MSDVTRSAAAQKLYEARRELEDLPAGEQQTRISVLLGELDALLPADEPRDRCADCDAIIPVPWFAANAIWNVVMPGTLKQRIVCAPCFMVRAESHFDRACWKLILEPKLSRTEDGTND